MESTGRYRRNKRKRRRRKRRKEGRKEEEEKEEKEEEVILCWKRIWKESSRMTQEGRTDNRQSMRAYAL